jgi:hypothetical protein
MAWWVKNHNKSLSSVKCYASKDHIVIAFDVDASKWSPVNMTFPILVRIFDENGQYLTHFTTAEGFTAFPQVFQTYDTLYQRGVSVGLPAERNKAKPVLLKPSKNQFSYTVNIRDLRDAAIVEIGFTER